MLKYIIVLALLFMGVILGARVFSQSDSSVQDVESTPTSDASGKQAKADEKKEFGLKDAVLTDVQVPYIQIEGKSEQKQGQEKQEQKEQIKETTPSEEK
jgi:hypothetical protein